jgi:hypothetical protein
MASLILIKCAGILGQAQALGALLEALARGAAAAAAGGEVAPARNDALAAAGGFMAASIAAGLIHHW